MKRLKSYHYGFSLVEALLAMGLVLTLLGMISTLMREYTAVSRHTAARDNTFDGVGYALTEMTQELGSSIKFVSPASADSSTSLEFYRINPNLKRFPDRDDASDDDEDDFTDYDTFWDPHAPQYLWNVRYYKEATSGALIREVVSSKVDPGPDPGTGRQVMVAKIDGLKVTKMNPEYYKVELSFVEDKRLRTYSRIGRAWCKP